ncbi:DUF262 domain-containing protein [Pseudoduganella sp. GCM10020061]|uniref:GmrSD restriction endonuclease domain-containing protein n=1 Tax=Pseudoduganella sp. GCM10020061 TaxID=3317345 RepID=UPI003637C677
MNILQQSSKAQDRTLGTWYVQVQSGTLKLPRFQRFEAWDRARVTGFLNTIIQNLPVGVTLLLQVGDKEQFISRYITSAPETGNRVTEHLLDGQQRLTAFWRSVHNNYEGETYFIYLPEFDAHPTDGIEYDEVTVHCQPRWAKKKEPGLRYPVWADSPARCLERGLVPVNLLCPGDHGVQLEKWIADATSELEPSDDAPDAVKLLRALEKRRQELRATLAMLRERVTHFNLPFLSLPATTSADVALQVFVNMNTNSKPLSMYDLTVAKVESEAGASLHAMQEATEAAYIELTHYGDVSWTLLTSAALMQGKMPNRGGVGAMGMATMVTAWPRVERALVRAAHFMARQHIYDEERLPSAPVVAVIAACFDKVPEHGDELGRAEQLLRAYMWSCFFTTRYEGAAATRAYQDYKALVELLERPHFGPADYAHVPVLRRVDYPLPTPEQLTRVGWPKGADRLARAVLAANLHFGALDFADGHPVSYESLRHREYHHIFPDALLQEVGINSYLALNCALVTWKTNRSIGRKDPLAYLRDRVEWADEDTVRQRLRTHLLDYDTLSQATYEADGEPLRGDALAARLRTDFDRFLESRAALVALAARYLAEGRVLTLEQLLREAKNAGGEPHEAALELDC